MRRPRAGCAGSLHRLLALALLLGQLGGAAGAVGAEPGAPRAGTDAAPTADVPDPDGPGGPGGPGGKETGEPMDTDEVEEIHVRGVRTRRLAERPSAFSSLVELDAYAGERITVADVIAQQVGVQVRRFGGPGDPAEVSIRGSTGAQVVVHLDGVRMDSVLTGTTNVSQLCPGLLESARITRGGDSIGTGEGAIGGSIDFTTRRPGARPVDRVKVEGGAFGTWEVDVQRAARAGPLEYGVGYCGFTTDGDFTFTPVTIQTPGTPATPRPPTTRINDAQVRHSANLSLGGDTGDHGHLRFSDYLTYASRGEPGLDSGGDLLAGQNPFAHSWQTHNLARLEWTADELGALGDAVETSLYHRYQRLSFDDPGVSIDDEPVSTLTQVHTFGLDAKSEWSYDLLAGAHAFDAIGRARRDALYAEDVPDEARTTAGVALSQTSTWWDERVAVVPGVRLEWVQGIGDTWLPAVGLVLTPLPWLRIQGNWQKSFRAPSFDELYLPDKGFIRGNPDLRPERATNADVGLVITLAQLGPLTDLRLEGGVFQQDVDDSIVWYPVSPSIVEANNTGPARVRGYELALGFSITRHLHLRANHTGLDSEALLTGRPLVGRTDAETFVRAELDLLDRWKLVGEMQRTGPIPVTPSGATLLPSRIVWSGSVAVDLAGLPWPKWTARLRAFRVYATLDNIGDVAVRDALFFPQPGRAGYLGTEIEW